jgi:predicted P-loop ATPase
LNDVAASNRYHPVRDFLDGLQWDGVPRIDTWLQDYAGAADTPFIKAVGRTFLVAGVRRIRMPGAKFDTLPVFESRQGMDKSVALRALAVRDEWFTDNLPLGSSTKEVIEQTRGVWIAEFAELSGIERRDVNHIKNFLPKQDDRARPAYGRRMETVPRQFIAAGSTNDAQYLLDMENRRFWPVKIKRFETAKLSRDVNKLWAEAAHYEAQGEPITLQEDLWGAAAEEQSAREVESPLKEMIARRLGREEAGWIPANEVWEILGVPVSECHRLAKAAGQAMTALGFERKQVRGQCSGGQLGDKGSRGDRFYERGNGEGGRFWWR